MWMLQPIAIGILNAVPYVRQYKSHLVLEWQINAGECSDEVNMCSMHTHIYIDEM